MKELSQKPRDKTQIVKQAEINKGLKHVGSTRIHRGHTLFEFNYVTGEINPAKIEIEVVADTQGSRTKKKVITNESCQYLGALNKKSLIKKLRRFGFYVKP